MILLLAVVLVVACHGLKKDENFNVIKCNNDNGEPELTFTVEKQYFEDNLSWQADKEYFEIEENLYRISHGLYGLSLTVCHIPYVTYRMSHTVCHISYVTYRMCPNNTVIMI